MKLNIEALKRLMQEKCNGNYNAFAKATGVDETVLYRLLNGQASLGLKNRNRLADYIAANAE